MHLLDAFNKLCKRFFSIYETGNLFRTTRIIGWPGKVYASNDIWLVEVNGRNSTYKLVLYYTHRIVNTLNDRVCQMGVLQIKRIHCAVPHQNCSLLVKVIVRQFVLRRLTSQIHKQTVRSCV